MRTTAAVEDILRVIEADHRDPFVVLGAHKITIDGTPCVAIRSYHPEAREIEVIDERTGSYYPMEMIHKEGFFEQVFAGCEEIFPYRLKLDYWAGHSVELHDPYSFLPYYTDFDLHLFGEGNNYYIYDKMGAHPQIFNGVKGVYMSVWAPEARRVSIIGEFNQWDGRRHQMRVLGGSGIWELFIPGMDLGDVYKFEVKTHDGINLDKSDPFAFRSELRPMTASIVHDYNAYHWNDDEWMETRKLKDWFHEPMLTYEVHLGSWMRGEDNRWLNYWELADRLVPYVSSMGYTHVEFLPVMEHPFDGSWGYQVTGYFSPTSRFGNPDGLKHLIDRFHQAGIGVILDWVPAHFPKDPHSLGRFDGTCVYEHLDPRQGEHMDWGTLIFNYGRNEVRNFLLSNAMYWYEKFHFDGLRIDAVASMLYLDYSKKDGQWVPNRYGGKENLEAIAFLRQLNEMVYSYKQGIFMIAEESTAWPMVSRPVYIGGLGFGFKWNMGWMNDILAYFKQDSLFRKYSHSKITFALWYAFTENFVLAISHDEVVHGKGSLINKMPGDAVEKFANLRVFFAYMYAHPGKKLHFMGAEIAQWREWNHDGALDWHLLEYDEHSNYHRFMYELNHFYKAEKTLWDVDFDSEGFEWIDFSDSDNSIIAFMRFDKNRKNHMVCVFNFTPVPRYAYRIGVMHPVFYREAFNTDSYLYGGTNHGNYGGVWADNQARHGHYHSIEITIPPLGAVFFKADIPEVVETVTPEPVVVAEPVEVKPAALEPPVEPAAEEKTKASQTSKPRIGKAPVKTEKVAARKKSAPKQPAKRTGKKGPDAKGKGGKKPSNP